MAVCQTNRYRCLALLVSSYSDHVNRCNKVPHDYPI